MPLGSPLLSVTDLAVTRGPLRIGLPALGLRPGGAAVLLGPSGCGKTTLLTGLLDLPAPVPVSRTGDIRFRGEPWPVQGTPAHARLLRKEALLLPQDAQQALDPFTRVLDFVQAWSAAEPEQCRRALQQLGLSD